MKAKDEYGIRAFEHAVASLEEVTAGDGGVRQRQRDLWGYWRLSRGYTA